MQPVKSTLPKSYSQVSTIARMSEGEPGAVVTTTSNVSPSSGCLFPDVGFADASSLNSLTTCFSPVRRRGTNGVDIISNFYYVNLETNSLSKLFICESDTFETSAPSSRWFNFLFLLFRATKKQSARDCHSLAPQTSISALWNVVSKLILLYTISWERNPTSIPFTTESVIDFSQIERSNCRKKMRLFFLALFLLPLVFSDWTGQEFVKKFNEKRREIAKREEIPNMRELVWSEDLVQEVLVIKDMDPNEERFIGGWGDSTYEDIFETFLLRDAPYIQRNNSKIGCNLVLDEDGKNVKVCILTPGIPKEYIELHFDIKNLFLDSGEAGSKCGDGYENDDGLCKSVTPTTSTVHTTTKKPASKTATAPISVPNQDVIEDSENDVPTEASSSYSTFSMVHILVVLGFGYSIFT
ncbi:unnamed protein product [Caenorhabditis nigoni]